MKLDASHNDMFGYEDKSGIQAWADALKTNSSLLELNLAKNDMDADDAKIFADGVSANGALVKFDISQNDLCADGSKAIAASLKDNQIMTELNIAGNWMAKKNPWYTADPDMAGVIAIGNAIPTMEALTSLNILNNNLLADGGKALAEALKGNNVIQELNISSNNLGYDSDMSAVIAMSDAIPTMGALASLNLASNRIGAEGAQHIAAALPQCK